MGDRVTAVCSTHLIPGPTGSPVPSPPIPFGAPLTLGTVDSVLISGKPAAVQGSSGMCDPPHVGLHPSDPFMPSAAQSGQVVAGSATVLIGGMPAATMASQCSVCDEVPGQLEASGTTVLIG